MLSIKPFGMTQNNVAVQCATLHDTAGNSVSFLNYGATMQSMIIKDCHGTLRDICLGYDTIAAYQEQNGCFGGLVGRCVNRIKPTQFLLDDHLHILSENRPGLHIHGGFVGFHQKIWDMSACEDTLLLTLFSPDGEEGYPGDLTVTLHVRFSSPGTVEMTYRAITNKETIINLTNHSYFNLDGHAAGDARLQNLKIAANEVAVPENGIPTGERCSVNNSMLDFRTLRPIQTETPLPFGSDGYDFCYLIDACTLCPCAQLTARDGGLSMILESDLPALQLYDGYGITPRIGKGGNNYAANSGICLEPEYVPNAINLATFPKPVFGPRKQFAHTVRYHFLAGNEASL